MRRMPYPGGPTNVSRTFDWYFAFNTNAGADPVSTTFKPLTGHWVATCTHSNPGEYTITLDSSIAAYDIASLGVEMTDPTGDGRYATIMLPIGFGKNTSGPITFKVWTLTTGAVKTDFAANQSVVYIHICFAESLVGH